MPMLISSCGEQPTVHDLLAFYADEYFPAHATSTQYQKQRLFIRFTQEWGSVPLAELSPDLLRQWRNTMRQRLAPGTVRYYMSVIGAALTVAVKVGWLPKHPMQHVQMPPMSPLRVRFLDEFEQERLFRACQRSRCRLLFPLVLMGISTGMRKREMLHLPWTRVDLVRGYVQLLRRKNKLRQAVALPEMTVAALQRWREAHRSPLVFPGRSGDKPADPDRAWYIALARAGIEDFHFHDLRHTAASYLALSGCDLNEIAEILGHKDINTTRRYVHLTLSHTKALVERMAQQMIVVPPVYD